MDKYTANKKLEEELRDEALERDMDKHVFLNPVWNIISETLWNIAEFVSKITNRDDISIPKVCLVNTESKALSSNKHTRELPTMSEFSYKIYFALAWDRYSFSEMTDHELSVLLAHEYFHFLESPKSLLIEEKLVKNLDLDNDLQKIVSESRADYFSWYFLKYCLESNLKNKSIITELENFILWLSELISNLRIDVQQWVFYSIDWDVHGTSDHRLWMFRQGLYNGNIEYLQKISNFIPERIEKIDSKDSKYYWDART